MGGRRLEALVEDEGEEGGSEVLEDARLICGGASLVAEEEGGGISNV